MPHMAPAPAAGAIPSRPVVPAAQPAVTKPLFPSAAQVGSLRSPPPPVTCTVVLIRPVPFCSKRQSVGLSFCVKPSPYWSWCSAPLCRFLRLFYSTKQPLVSFVLLCHCCGLLLTMLQMGSGVHSSTAAVSSPPLDLQSVSSQPSFPNTPQVRSQNRECGTCMRPLLFRTVPELFFLSKRLITNRLCFVTFAVSILSATLASERKSPQRTNWGRGGLVGCELY